MTEFKLVITNLNRKDWCAPVKTSPEILGRGPLAEIRIPTDYQTVSRRHAKVWHDHGGVWICDLKSTCGTWVNGVRIVPGRPVRVASGDRILLGKLELLLMDPAETSGIAFIDSQSPDQGENTVSFKPIRCTGDTHEINMISTLSNAERDVLLWVSRGYTTPEEICKQIKRSPHTVRTQLNSIFKKLAVHSRDELVGYLLRTTRRDPAADSANSR